MGSKTSSLSSKKVYNFLLALLTFLNGYALFFAGSFSIGMLIATAYSVLGLVQWILNPTKKGFYYPPLVVTLLFVLLSLPNIFFLPKQLINQRDVFYNISKIGVWAVMVSLTGYFYFNYRLFSRYMIRIAIVGTVFLIFQFIMVVFLKISIPNTLDFGIIRPTYLDYAYSISHFDPQIRLSSFWMEPAQYGNYVVGALVILIFDNNLKVRKKKIVTILLSLGVILSTSSGALYMMIIFFSIHLLISNKKRRNIIVLLLPFVVTVIVILFVSYPIMDKVQGMGTVGYSIYRALTKITLWRNSSRIGASFDAIIKMSEYGVHKYIGLGVGNDIGFLKRLGRDFTYLNSVARTIIWNGYFGFVAYTFIPISLFIRNKRNRVGVMFSLYCFLGGFYSGLWYSPDAIVFYTIAAYSIRDNCCDLR